MLEQIDLSQSIDKDRFKEIWVELERRLGKLQRQARSAVIPTIIVFEGWDAAGKGTCINRIVLGLDPRGYKVHPINPPTTDETLHPFLWRFWAKVPRRGSIAIFDRSWYGRVLVERVEGVVAESDWRAAYGEILQFERQLADDGAVIIKFWLHIGEKDQRRRFRKLERNASLAWKVTDAEWRQNKRYDDYVLAVEEMLERTGTAHAPWTVVEATDRRFAWVKIAETIAEALERGLARAASASSRRAATAVDHGETPRETLSATVLDRVDLSLTMGEREYDRTLKNHQKRLFTLEHEIFLSRVPVVIVYEGWDASGKGGNIKRLTRGLDPRGYEVIPVGPPSQHEMKYHYLWRFWREAPKAGHIVIFDRSWYGRVLVERLEGFCSDEEWMRAYREINEFEEQLVSFGTVIVKFWLHISGEEQLKRFRRREQIPYKKWKIGEEDWRNREKRGLYRVAVAEMLERTSTSYAPWTIVEADSKKYARVKTLRTVVTALERALDGRSRE